jgi:hypothetical protein
VTKNRRLLNNLDVKVQSSDGSVLNEHILVGIFDQRGRRYVDGGSNNTYEAQIRTQDASGIVIEGGQMVLAKGGYFNFSTIKIFGMPDTNATLIVQP